MPPSPPGLCIRCVAAGAAGSLWPPGRRRLYYGGGDSGLRTRERTLKSMLEEHQNWLTATGGIRLVRLSLLWNLNFFDDGAHDFDDASDDAIVPVQAVAEGVQKLRVSPPADHHRSVLSRRYTLHTIHCRLHTAPCTLHTVPCTLYPAHCTLQTVHWTRHTAHCNGHRAHYTFKTAHWTGHTAHWTMHLDQFRKHSRGSDSLPPLIVSFKYDDKQFLHFVFQNLTAFFTWFRSTHFCHPPIKTPKIKVLKTISIWVFRQAQRSGKLPEACFQVSAKLRIGSR